MAPRKNAPSADRELANQFTRFQGMFPELPLDRVWAATAEYFDERGDGSHTLAAWKSASAANPEWGRWHLELAKTLIRLKQFDQAFVHLSRCVDLDASGCDTGYFATNPLYYLGYALFNLGRRKEASEAWRGAETTVMRWRDPEPLKDFHFHRGFAFHVEKNILDAMESYRRALVAPGPGDGSDDDTMDPDAVEAAQAMNDRIEPWYLMARRGEIPEEGAITAIPYTGRES
jgi:tetratricopeptide (TPR) repeat protein